MNGFERIKHSAGYWLLSRPNHPYRNSQGYIPEARIVMEEAIGRYINPLIEVVHHRDTNVQNNKLDNLIILTKSAHRRLHSGWQFKEDGWWKTCSACGRFLKVEDNFSKRRTGHCEYVTQCRECIRKISAINRPSKMTPEERRAVRVQSGYKSWRTRRNRGK